MNSRRHSGSRRPKVPTLVRRRRCRLRVEVLESRQLLSTVDWSSSTSGKWDVASNWSTDTVPAAGDNVVINVPRATVTISSTVEAVNSVTIDDPLDISGGGLTVAADSTISGGLTVSGGTLGGAGAITVTGAFNWTGGDLNGAGATTLARGGTLSLSGSSMKFLTGGYVLNNEGSGTWSGTGEFDGSPGSTFNNIGTFTAQSDTNFSNGGQGAGMIFNNSGTFTKSGTSGTTSFIGNSLNNSGTVDVDSGTLSLNAGSATQIETGILNVGSGAELQFVSNFDTVSEGHVELKQGTQLRGSGLYELDLGTITVDAILSVANFTMTGGQLNGPDTLTITGAFDWSGGDLDGAGATTVASGATLSFSGSSTKLLTGSHILNNAGTGTWAGVGEFDGNPGSFRVFRG
jgi:phage baseplate assembly protein gpV